MRTTTYPESKWIGRIWRRWVEAVNEKCVAAIAGSSIHGNVLNAFVWWSINYPAQVVVVEGGGGSTVVEGDTSVRIVDVLLVGQSQMQIEIGRSRPDKLPADDAGAAYRHESTART